MIMPATDATVVRQNIDFMGGVLADSMGYVENPKAWFPGATRVWVDANEPKRKVVRLPKFVQPPAHRMIVAQPRQLIVTHEDYGCWFTIDSSYRHWTVYCAGDPRALEYVLQPIWETNELWRSTQDPWIEDAKKRQDMTRMKWAVSTGSTRTHLHPDSLETASDSSTPPTSKSVPTFGDLSSLAKPSRKKTAR